MRLCRLIKIALMMKIGQVNLYISPAAATIPIMANRMFASVKANTLIWIANMQAVMRCLPELIVSISIGTLALINANIPIAILNARLALRRLSNVMRLVPIIPVRMFALSKANTLFQNANARTAARCLPGRMTNILTAMFAFIKANTLSENLNVRATARLLAKRTAAFAPALARQRP